MLTIFRGIFMFESEFISIGQAAKLIGVSIVTLRRWEKLGKLKANFRTFGNHRRYKINEILNIFQKEKRINIGYARVSSHDQKDDLQRQKSFLEKYGQDNNIENYEILSDLGSGLNFKKKGLNKLISLIISSKIDTIYLTHKDRLLRFGTELIINIAHKFGTKVVIIKDTQQTFEEQLASDVLEIITVFSARLYGSRSNKKKKLLTKT